MLHRAHRIGLLAVALALFASPASAQTGTIGYSWQGATLANEGSGWPPDTNGSVGINQYVQAVNGGYQMYNKDGSGYSFPTNAISNNTFWTTKVSGVAPGSSSFSDPRIYYDPMSQRWFAVEITTPSSNNRILIARSDTSDPRGSWKGLTVNSASGQFADYPTLAVDANGVYIGVNNFNAGGQRSMISVPLTNFLANPATTTPNVFNNPPNGSNPFGFTMHGVTDTTGATVGATTALMFGTNVNSGGSDVLARTIINNPAAAGTATLTGPSSANGGYIAVLPSAISVNAAPQGGTGLMIDNGDNRNSSMIYRVGDLIYMARAVDSADSTGRSVARWTVLSVNNSTNAIAVVKEGTIDLGTTGSLHAFYPSIAANARGDFVMSFSRSGTSEFPSIWAVVGTTTDHLNWAVGAPFQLQAGSTFEGNGTGGGRWGDYSSTTRDPSDPGSFWVTSEYMHNVAAPGLTANQNWATQVVEVIPTIAGEVRWKTAAAGTFGTTTNWQTGTAPISTDHVIFSRWSGTSYQVDLPTATTTTNDRLSVRQTGTGTVTFNIASGATWSLTNPGASTPSLAISEFQGQSNVVFSGGGTLQTNFGIIAGQSGGTGNLTITGVSTTSTTWNNANDLFIGGTNAASGGTGALTVSAGATANVGGTLTLWNTASGITVTGSGSTLSVAGLTNAGGTTPAIALNSGGALTITDGLGTAFSGTISGGGTLTKSGAGSFTLSGNNTYSGQTTVSAGTLLISGQTGSNSGTGTGAVVVNGGTLGGTGRIGGTVTVNSAARLAAGVGGTGTLTIAGNTTLNNGGKFGASVGASGTSNQIAMQGATTTIDFKTGSILDLSLVSGFSKTSPGSYTLVSLPGGSGNNILVDGLATANNAILGTYIEGTGTSGAVVIQPSGMGLDAGDQFVFTRSGDLLLLQFTPVPEPATVLALSAAVLGVGTFVRRRGRRQLSVLSH